VNGRRGEDELAVLIKHSAELKRDLVDFACSPRLKRSLAAAMAEVDPEELERADSIDVIDRFALQYRKAWYYRREPRPGVSVIGARLAELALDGRG
jgi:hypothetical protein